MQALLLIAVFSFVFSVIGGIIAGTGPGSSQLTRLRQEETQSLFRAIELIAMDTTLNELQLGTASTSDFTALMRTNNDFSQLSVGKWGDIGLDSWGSPVTTLIARENRVLLSGSFGQIVAPVTTIALVSPGPNRTLETSIPTNPSGAAMQGILPPTGSDDIVSVFNNENAQQQVWNRVKSRIDRITSAEIRYLQYNMFTYRQTLMQNYQNQLKDDNVTAVPDIQEVMNSDPSAPTYLDINSDLNRRTLGIDDDFYVLEHISTNGTFQFGSSFNPDNSITLNFANNGATPTPWGNPASSLSYQINLKRDL